MRHLATPSLLGYKLQQGVQQATDYILTPNKYQPPLFYFLLLSGLVFFFFPVPFLLALLLLY